MDRRDQSAQRPSQPAASGGQGNGRYYSTWGPPAGLIRDHDVPGLLGVLREQGKAETLIGLAHPVAKVNGPKGLAVVYRLWIADRVTPGLWVCRGREFLRVTKGAS